MGGVEPSDNMLSKQGSARQSDTYLKEQADLAARFNRERLLTELESRGKSIPFRADERSRDERIRDIVRAARLIPRKKRPVPKPGDPPPPLPTVCDSGWNNVLASSTGQTSIGSALYQRPVLETAPPETHVGYSGTSALSYAHNGSFHIGAVIGDYCDLEWTPPDQRVRMGAYECATISASFTTMYELSKDLAALSPNALTVKANVLRGDLAFDMFAGDPAEEGGGFVWGYCTATLDVVLGILFAGPDHRPRASSSACLINRMGAPVDVGTFPYNGVNGPWNTQITTFDDGDYSDQVLTATIGGSGTKDSLVFVTVSVNVVCVRYPGSNGFVGIQCLDPAETPLIVTPDLQYVPPRPTSPILLNNIAVCGI